MDRHLARKNVRTALIAGGISILIFGMAFLSALVYNG